MMDFMCLSMFIIIILSLPLRACPDYFYQDEIWRGVKGAGIRSVIHPGQTTIPFLARLAAFNNERGERNP